MMRVAVGFGVGTLVLALSACGDDTPAPTPATGGGAGAPTAGTTSGSPAASGSSASGSGTGGGTAGMTTGGVATGGGGSGSGGSTAGSGGSAAGSGGSAAGSGGSGGSGGGGSCDTKAGKALKLDGGKVDILSANLGNDLPGGNVNRTIELWAKFTGATSWDAERSVIETGKHVTAGNQILGIDMSGRKQGSEATQGLFGPYTNGLSDNNGQGGVLVDAAENAGWLHLAWSFDSNSGLIFTVNGVKKTVENGDKKLTLDLTPGIVTLGCSQNYGPPEGWTGVMDEVKIWSVSKTPADILANMRVIPKADTAGLVAYYRFNGDTGTEAADEAKKATHTLKPCAAKNDICPAANTAGPTWIDSDVTGPFTCAP